MKSYGSLLVATDTWAVFGRKKVCWIVGGYYLYQKVQKLQNTLLK